MERRKTELEKIMAFSLDMICTINEEGCFVKVSSASATVLDYEPEELTGRPYLELVHPDDRESTLNCIEAIMAGRMVHNFGNRYIRKDGGIRPLLWSSNWDPEERILYCIARDGSGKKHSEALQRSLEESNRRYEYVTKATSDAIWDWNLEKNTLYWGEGFTTVFGYKLDEIACDISSWAAHVHPDDAPAVVGSVYQIIDSGETNWKKEYRYQRADGSYAEVVDRGFVIRDASGKAIRMVGAMHDISERKKSLAELKQFADDLYKRNREMQQFGYVVSHNLRLPVANIMGIANLMEADRDNTETIDLCIANLKASVGSLDEVIRDLSVILSLSDGSLEIIKEPIDIQEIIQKVTADLNPIIMETNALIHVPQGHYVLYSHKAYLYSIFYNLISNGIKYRSDQAPTIFIKVDDSRESLVIHLTDNGIGIDLQRHQDHLFRPYTRFTSERKGKGLGLFLVKSHVEALQGTIAVQSQPGKGTSFEIEFFKEKNPVLAGQ